MSGLTGENWFKVLRLDMGSFADPSFRYRVGRKRRAPKVDDRRLCHHGLLHASPTPEQAADYGQWPYRLFRVEPDAPPVVAQGDKAGFLALTLVEELPVHLCWGPNGQAVERVVRRAERLTREEARKLAAAWYATRSATRYAAGDAAWDAAWDAAGYAAWDAAGDAAWDAARSATRYAAGYAAWDAAGDAALAQCVADLVGQYGLTQEHIDTLMAPWLSVIGEDW